MKRILLTNGHATLNRKIAAHLLKGPNALAVLFPNQAALDHSREELSGATTIAPGASGSTEVESCLKSLGGIDVLLHGHPMLDEDALFAEDVRGFANRVRAELYHTFSITRAVIPHMIRQKSGQIVFVLLCDALHYAGYLASPVVDLARLSMMKCLSRELTAFHIQVNALTLGYHGTGLDASERESRRKRLTIYGSKPSMVPIEDLIPAIDMFVSPPTVHVAGQNLHVGVSGETLV